MAGRLPLRTNNLPTLSPLSEEASVQSPARGRETRTALLQKLRPPPLVHAWDFWHEKPVPPTSTSSATSADYTPQLSQLHSITDVRTFWSLFNNFDFSVLPSRTAVHLFHKSVKPIWEDVRNIRGGSWTFRIPKASSVNFWREICLLAIGEQLQEAVRDETRTKFRDDICGISFMPRGTAVTLVCIWNRDGDNQKGIQAILDVVMQNIDSEVKPAEGSYYYKKHSAHAGFNGSAVTAATAAAVTAEKHANGTSATNGSKLTLPAAAAVAAAATASTTADDKDLAPIEQRQARKKTEEEDLKEAAALLATSTAQKNGSKSTEMAEMAEKMDAMEREVMKLRKILEEVKLRDEALALKLAKEEEGNGSNGERRSSLKETLTSS